MSRNRNRPVIDIRRVPVGEKPLEGACGRGLRLALSKQKHSEVIRRHIRKPPKSALQ